MKSHDFHIWIERILPAMVRGYVPEHVWLALAELSYFFRQLCAKELARTMIADLERMAPVLLCKLEKIFPPGFFNPRTTTTTPLSRTSQVLAPQVRGVSTCEVPRVSLSDPYFVTDVR